MPWMATEMPSRRRFIVGAAAVGIVPSISWANAGSPSYLSAARMPDDSYRLFGLDADVRPIFSLPLPGRGHAAAGHPYLPEAVAFARRPGTFALVLDCANGTVTATLKAPPKRHFYGHGVFSQDGSHLYTTENAFEIGEGRIGIWDTKNGYRRLGEFPSGGIGPHDIARLPGSDILVVANGGIDTHPDTGREKLNIPTMRPNLAYVSVDGLVMDQVELPAKMNKNSIRHVDVREDGLVAFGCQWQGDLSLVPQLVGLHRIGGDADFMEAPESLLPDLFGYIGSVAFSGTGTEVAFTAPRGDRALVFDAKTKQLLRTILATDICGVAPSSHGLVATTGMGLSGRFSSVLKSSKSVLAWDNHLVVLRDHQGSTA